MGLRLRHPPDVRHEGREFPVGINPKADQEAKARVSMSLYELAANSFERVTLLASVTEEPVGTIPFEIRKRIYGLRHQKIQGDTWETLPWGWFDVGITGTLQQGHRYELAVTDVAPISGQVNEANNWVHTHPFMRDYEGRAYGSPFEVCGLICVVDGTLRGTPYPGNIPGIGPGPIPFMLMKPE